MPVSGQIVAQLQIIETLTTGVAAVGSPKVTHDGFSQQLSLSGTSTPPITEIVSLSGTLSGSTAVIDLSSVVGVGGTYDLTSPAGQRIQALFAKNPSSSNTLRLEDNSSNGYPLFGDAAAFCVLPPGGWGLWFMNDYCDAGGNVLDATHKQLLLTGTSGQGYQLQVVVG